MSLCAAPTLAALLGRRRAAAAKPLRQSSVIARVGRSRAIIRIRAGASSELEDGQIDGVRRGGAVHAHITTCCIVHALPHSFRLSLLELCASSANDVECTPFFFFSFAD